MAGRAILVIGDGLGDRPVKGLGGQTPLEAAKTPNLDKVAAQGECGLLDPIAPGVRAGSDTAHLSLLGYDPYEVYTGRGPFEAMGIGMDVRRGDVCFRCNFSTVTEKYILVADRRAGRIKEGTAELAHALSGLEFDGVSCIFKESVEHRGALILRGEGLGPAVTDVDPEAVGKHVHWARGSDPASEKAARVTNEFVSASFEVLRHHPVNERRRMKNLAPANIILTRGAGVAPHIEPFADKYGFTAACVVEVGLIKGIGKYLDMEVVDVPGATGGHDTDETALANAAVDALERHAFVLCNLKAPDLGGHDGDPKLKMADIVKLDNLVGQILKRLPGDTHLAVTGDHSTPVTFHDHSGDPLPIALFGPNVRTDRVKAFGERPCAEGGVGRIRGINLMNVITNLAGLQEKFGA